jgi:methionyl-tRNA formyltransferase
LLQFLPQKFLDIPACGTLNVHPSLLPKYRGASPVQRCLQAGDSATGVSVLYTVLKMDSGPVLRQSTVQLTGSEQAPELLRTLFELGTAELVAALPQVWTGTAAAAAVQQDSAAASEAPKISASEAQCCFATESALQVHNKVRAFAGWPGAWAWFQKSDAAAADGADSDAAAAAAAKQPLTKLKLMRTEVGQQQPHTENSRAVSLQSGALEVVCADGSVLRVLQVQPEGKKPMDAKSYVNGLRGATLSWIAAATADDAAAV